MIQSLHFSSESHTHTHTCRPPGQRSNRISWYKNNHKCSKSQSDRKSALWARPRGRSQQPKCLSFTFPPEEPHLDRWVCLQQIKTNIKNKRNDDEAVPTAARSNTNTTPRKTRHPETVWRQSVFTNWFRVSDRKQTSETFRIKLERRSESFQNKVFNAATSVSIYTINIPAKRLKTRTKWAEGQRSKVYVCVVKKKKKDFKLAAPSLLALRYPRMPQWGGAQSSASPKMWVNNSVCTWPRARTETRWNVNQSSGSDTTGCEARPLLGHWGAAGRRRSLMPRLIFIGQRPDCSCSH